MQRAGTSTHEDLAGSGRRVKRGRAGQAGTLGDYGRPSWRPALEWYFSEIYDRTEGPGAQPFYCDHDRVGNFAVAPADLAAGADSAIFRLFVTLAMYQALRDVAIMRRQHELPRATMRVVADAGFVKRAIARHNCPVLLSADSFEEGCDVSKDDGVIDCGRSPGARCHVKDATVAFNRMGDMGKLPTSAWLRLWKGRGLRKVLADVCSDEASPAQRARLLVERFARIHRVGRKLATMFVSALSTPALAPGLTPWFPDIDGNELVVIDTNVARAVDALRQPGALRTYDARERWVRDQAAQIDLRGFRPDLPSYSPRLVQQALYAFCSKSNRVDRGDICAERATSCAGCAPALCPLAPAGSVGRSPLRQERNAAPAVIRASVGAAGALPWREPPASSSQARHRRGANGAHLELPYETQNAARGAALLPKFTSDSSRKPDLNPARFDGSLSGHAWGASEETG